MGKMAGMHRLDSYLRVAACLFVFHLAGHSARAVTEVMLDKDFLAGIVEKLPPSPFEKKGQYRGTVHSNRLLAIDPKRRRFLAACQIEGEFRPPVTGPVSERISRSEDHTRGMRKFRFEITAGVNIEAGPDSMPRFRVDVEEVKKAELEGIAGLLAKLLGKFFDDMVTRLADGRASLLSQKLNSEVLKRSAVFKQYGAFCGIDYTPDQVVLRFDLTRFKSEGIVGYVYSTPQPGTVPLHRWFDRRVGSHEYTISPGGQTDRTWSTRASPVTSSTTRFLVLSRCMAGTVGEITSTRSRPTGRASCARATGRQESPASSIPPRRPARSPFTGSSIHATACTSTQLTRTRSSRNSGTTSRTGGGRRHQETLP